MDLGPLGDAQASELVEGLAGGRPGRRLAGLMAQAGGNPLYARELVDGLVREGRVRVAGVWRSCRGVAGFRCRCRWRRRSRGGWGAA